MTDKPRISSRFASATVTAFLKTATAGQRCWYLAQGEPQCLSGQFLSDGGNLVERLYPGLRGVRVGNEVKTAEEAIAAATATRTNLLAMTDLEQVDERALGIDDEALDLADRFDEVGARLESIVHIGSMRDNDGAEPLREMIGDLDREHPNGLFDDLPFLDALLKRMEPNEEDDDDVPDPREILDEFLMAAHDNGAMGFIVEVSVPLYKPHADGNGCSVHGGTRYLEQRYASTFQVACDRALEWAEARIDEMRKGKSEATKKAITAE